MAIENASMMWLKPPAACYKLLNKKLRGVINSRGAGGLTDELSDMCDEYWKIYMDIHNGDSKESSIQAYYIFQAMVKILKDYGWWDVNNNNPIDWQQEEPA